MDGIAAKGDEVMLGEIDDRLKFTMLDDRERDLLRAAKSEVVQALDGILDRFYRHVLQTPATAVLLQAPGRLEHAKAAQKRHWERLFGAEFDDAYLRSVTEIGKAHHRIGLEPRYYVGAYAIVLCELERVLLARHKPRMMGGRNETLADQMNALTKAVMLDTGLVIDVYLAAKQDAHIAFVERIATDFRSSVVEVMGPVRDESTAVGEGARKLSEMAIQASERSAAVSDAGRAGSENVQTIAAAIEELSASIRDISNHVQEQTRVSAQAREDGKAAASAAAALGAVAGRISEMVALIAKIAGQTNLLALNASIEAARAGDAGKGFAVVAGEVKSLAGQTEKATNDIRRLVEEVGGVVTDVHNSTRAVITVIDAVDEATEAIAAAVEEQSVATRSISESIQQTARGIKSVAENIHDVDGAIRFTREWAERMRGGVDSMRGRVDCLDARVGDFVGKLTASG